MAFASADDAYRDWMAHGRSAGLAYAPGKNTYLKIMLKVKDEPELIVKWIEHHGAIVGYHNLVIMNCGSVNAHFLEILHGYRDGTISRLKVGSFGQLLVFHLATLGPALVRSRALKHLHAKGIVPADMATAEVEAGDLVAAALEYVNRYMATPAPGHVPCVVVAGGRPVPPCALRRALMAHWRCPSTQYQSCKTTAPRPTLPAFLPPPPTMRAANSCS